MVNALVTNCPVTVGAKRHPDGKEHWMAEVEELNYQARETAGRIGEIDEDLQLAPLGC